MSISYEIREKNWSHTEEQRRTEKEPGDAAVPLFPLFLCMTCLLRIQHQNQAAGRRENGEGAEKPASVLCALFSLYVSA
jgi:hypothetical protein